MAKQPKDKGKEMKKTTIRLPEKLWLETRIHGLNEGINFQDIIEEALELYLKQSKGNKPRKGGKR